MRSICDRTDQVEEAIIAAVTGVTACQNLTSAHLQGITTLILTNKGIESLQSGDFDGLTGLTILSLASNSLTELPAGVFDKLTALTQLTLNNNALTVLPDDVFEHLAALATLDLVDNPGSNGFKPTAKPTPVQGVEQGDLVTLDGSDSGGPWGSNIISYAWAQTGGTDVTLTGAATATATFTAPDSDGELVFTLTVTGRGVDVNDDSYTHSARAQVYIGRQPLTEDAISSPPCSTCRLTELCGTTPVRTGPT